MRKRIKRGTLEAEKDLDGKVWVWLDAGRTSPDGDWTTARMDGNGSEDLTEILRDQVNYLRRQLEVWQEEARRKDHIIAALTERIPEIEAPREAASEATESRVTASEEPYSTHAPPKPRYPVERPSWWRKFFGFE